MCVYIHVYIRVVLGRGRKRSDLNNHVTNETPDDVYNVLVFGKVYRENVRTQVCESRNWGSVGEHVFSEYIWRSSLVLQTFY
jgi:hypothetical protein